jgi:phage shock protein PspC (stress-responsive transcriptional regulator)
MADSMEPSGSTGPSGRRRLQRNQHERLLSGVCAGLGDYLGVDANVVRIAFALAALVPPLTAISVLGYIALAVLLPVEGSERLPSRQQVQHNLRELRTDVESVAGNVRRGLSGNSRDPGRTEDRTTIESVAGPTAPTESEIEHAAAGSRRINGQG